jgi:hypothetical protein
MLAGASALAGSSFLKGNSVFCQPPPDGKFPDSVKVLETRDMRYCSCPFWVSGPGDFMKKYAQKKPVQDYKSEDFKENFEIIKAEQS